MKFKILFGFFVFFALSEGKTVYNITTDFGNSLDSARDVIGATNATLQIDTVIANNLASTDSLPSNICLSFSRDGQIVMGGNKTINIQGNIQANLWKIFNCSTSDTVKLGNAKNSYVYPEWWGAVTAVSTPDSSTKRTNAIAIQNSINTGNSVLLSNGTYCVNSTIQVGTTDQRIAGTSRNSILEFDFDSGPDSIGLLITCDLPTEKRTEGWRVTIQDLTIQGDADTLIYITREGAHLFDCSIMAQGKCTHAIVGYSYTGGSLISQKSQIEHCKISSNEADSNSVGILIQNQANNFAVTHCDIEKFGILIRINSSPVNVIIRDNYFMHNSSNRYGIYIGGNGSLPYDCSIENNYFEDILKAIRIGGNLTYNLSICRNYASTNNDPPTAGSYFVSFDSLANVQAENIIIENNLISAYEYAFQINTYASDRPYNWSTNWNSLINKTKLATGLFPLKANEGLHSSMGKIGINTVTPTEILTVKGNISDTGNIVATGGLAGGTLTVTSLSALDTVFSSKGIKASVFDGALKGNVTGTADSAKGAHHLNGGNVVADSINVHGTVIQKNGKVGIGTSGPQEVLHLKSSGWTTLRVDGPDNPGAGGPDILLKQGSYQWENYIPASDSSLRWNDGTGDRVTFKHGGNIGIGTTNPDTAFELHIQTNGSAGHGLLVKGAGRPELRIQSTSGSEETRLRFKNPDCEYLMGTSLAGSNNEFTIRDVGRNKELIHCDDDGNVGIGTTSPQGKLDVAGTTGGLVVPRLNNTEESGLSGVVNGTIIYNTTTNKFRGYANGGWVDLH